MAVWSGSSRAHRCGGEHDVGTQQLGLSALGQRRREEVDDDASVADRQRERKVPREVGEQIERRGVVARCDGLGDRLTEATSPSQDLRPRDERFATGGLVDVVRQDGAPQVVQGPGSVRVPGREWEDGEEVVGGPAEVGDGLDEFVVDGLVQRHAPQRGDVFGRKLPEDFLGHELLCARDAGVGFELDERRPAVLVERRRVDISQSCELLEFVGVERQHLLGDLDRLAAGDQPSGAELVEPAATENRVGVLGEIEHEVVEHVPSCARCRQEVDVVDHDGHVHGAEVPELVGE